MISSASSTVVLKFGSSVLRSAASLPVAVAEVYRHYREGERVVAVVSAFEGVTDQLLTSARSLCNEPDPATLAALLSTGETGSAAQLTLALHRGGVPAQLADPRDLGLTAAGDRANAELVSFSRESLASKLAWTPILVVPGFFAQHADGGLALLGRGGSDLTALYLASELDARCVLLKDVDGLYESDPAAATRPGTPPVRRYALAGYATAENHAGPLIQGKSIRFARARRLAIDVTRVGSSRRTRIGEVPTVYASAAPSRRIRVALLGLGTVGAGVLEQLQEFPERFEVVGALVRNPEKHLRSGLPREVFAKSIDEVLSRKAEIIIEALPGLEPARSFVGRALRQGLRVVTANKALLAAEWTHLSPHLLGPRRRLRFAAAVGGSVPMLETVERLTRRTRITRLRGVLNGTTNFILDRIAAGESLAEAVRRTQTEGFAEANPTEDLSGRDTERKLTILASLAFGGTPICERLEGIDQISSALATPAAEDLNPARLRLVAEAERTPQGYTYRIAPAHLPPTDFLAGPRGAENGLEVTTANGAVHRLQGLGAGRVPTATAVFADLLEHARALQDDALEQECVVGSEASTLELCR